MLQNFRVIFMDIPSAEMTKYAANAMLATRISFMNDIANLCERVGANVDSVRKGIGTDSRIGSKFLYAGCGYGGSCFPKDVKALVHTGMDNGYHMEVIEAVERVNEKQKSIVYDKIIKAIGVVRGKTIAVIGLAFKPDTDDMREAPALVVIDKLLKDGAAVRVFDPIAMDECKRRIGDTVTYCKNMYDAADGADVFALMTEWHQFRLPSWNVIKKIMKGYVVVDGRNIYDRNGTLLATASDKGTLIRIFDVKDGKLLIELRRGTTNAEINCIIFDEYNKHVACASGTGTVHIFSIVEAMKSNYNENYYSDQNDTNETKNQKSFLSGFNFLHKISSSYFGSEWSFAKLRLQEHKSIISFLPNNTICALTSDGKYCLASFDPKKPDDCVKKKEFYIYDTNNQKDN